MMDVANPVLARKLGLVPEMAEVDAPADVAAVTTSMRQMRRALGRAADTAVGLSASVMGISEEEVEAETLIETGPQGWVVIGMRDGSCAGLTGLFLMDPAFRSAMVEQQTLGYLLPTTDDTRPVTRTDAVLSQPFAAELLAELDEVGFGGDALSPAGFDMGPMDDLRTAGLVMVQGIYHIWRITVQMGGGDRQGEILIAMRPKVDVTPEPVRSRSDWSAALRGALDEAEAELDAVLTTMTLSMDKVENFEVGQVLHLAGTTVGSLMLMGPDGKMAAKARLGQVAGKRAVRIQQTVDELQEAPPMMPPAATRVVSSLPDLDPPRGVTQTGIDG